MAPPKTENSRLKRVPENSHTIILKFRKKSERDDCMALSEFKKAVGELAALVTKYNSSFEIFSWNILSGTSVDIENQKIIN